MAEPNILEIRDLVKEFKVKRENRPGTESFAAVDHVSMTLPTGGSLGVLGESGSGKSTTARIVVGLETATSGSVRVQGQEWHPERTVGMRARRRRGGIVQMVFQDPYQSLNRRQTVGACLDEALRLHTNLDPSQRKRRATELLEQVRIPSELATATPRTLSGGQRQRVAIARALAADPRLLLLDESVSALDVSVQAQVLKVLEEIRAETGVSLLFISHDLAVVEQICDDVVVMRHGRIVESGSVEQVLGSPQEAYTRRLIASVPHRGWKPRRWLNTTSIAVPTN